MICVHLCPSVVGLWTEDGRRVAPGLCVDDPLARATLVAGFAVAYPGCGQTPTSARRRPSLMLKRSALILISLFAGATGWAQNAPAPLAQRIGHYDPSLSRESAGHNGRGGLRHMNLVNTRYVTGNLGFVQK